MQTTDSLQLKIAELEADNADRFDPVRFCYIRSLARRALDKPGPVYSVIGRKAVAALAEYQDNFTGARKQAAATVNRVCSQFPDAADHIRALFEKNEFKKVHQLARKLDQRRGRSDLSDLKSQIGRLAPAFADKNQPVSVEDLLRQQEQDILASTAGLSAGDGFPPPPEKKEPASLKRFKQTMVKLHSERLVTATINDCPENAGPHNSQMLAINTLAALRQVAPEYLDRFVAHIGTLIWLKQAGEETDKINAGKSKSSKSRAKKSKTKSG